MNQAVSTRRRRGRPTIDSSIPSPCVSLCQVDDHNVCVGCARNIDEIRDWIIMGREQKLAVLEQVALRRASRLG